MEFIQRTKTTKNQINLPAFFNILIKKAGNLYQNFVLFVEPTTTCVGPPPHGGGIKITGVFVYFYQKHR